MLATAKFATVVSSLLIPYFPDRLMGTIYPEQINVEGPPSPSPVPHHITDFHQTTEHINASKPLSGFRNYHIC